MIGIPLSQAHGIMREVAKHSMEPLKIIIAKAPNRLFDDVQSINSSNLGKENSTVEHDARCCHALDSSDRRKFCSLTFCRRHKSKSKESAKKRKGPWYFKLNCCRLRKNLDTAEIPEANVNCEACICTGYRRTDEHHLGAGIVFESIPPNERRILDYPRFTRSSSSDDDKSMVQAIDFNKTIPTKDYPTEDCDERARAERAREIEEGIEHFYYGIQPRKSIFSVCRFVVTNVCYTLGSNSGIIDLVLIPTTLLCIPQKPCVDLLSITKI